MAASDRSGIGRSGDRDKALETALVQIERQFGKGWVMRLGDDARAPVEVLPTGSIALDVALGIGGLPRGRVVEVFGPESSGKCATADTMVWTDRGLESIAEVFARCEQDVECTTRITNVRAFGVPMLNDTGDPQQLPPSPPNPRHPAL